MVTPTHGEVAGGAVPATGAHPPVEGGSLQGHGGTALRMFVGLSESQASATGGETAMSLLGFEEASRPRSTLGSGSLGTRNGRGGAATCEHRLCGRSGTAGEWKAVLRR